MPDTEAPVAPGAGTPQGTRRSRLRRTRLRLAKATCRKRLCNGRSLVKPVTAQWGSHRAGAAGGRQQPGDGAKPWWGRERDGDLDSVQDQCRPHRARAGPPGT